MLMATTEGLTLAMTEIKSGSGWFCSEGGGVQLGSVGVVGVEGGETSAGGKAQLLPRKRHKIIRQVSKYFMLIFFNVIFIIARWQN